MKNIGKSSFLAVWAVLVAVWASLLAVGCTSGSEGVKIPQYKAAPEFELKDPWGKVHRLSDFKGGVTLVHFWASWCPPCIDEIPRWIEGAGALKGLPVRWLAITVDEEWEKALRIFPKEKLGSNMVLLLDPTGEVAKKIGTTKFPESYVLNKDLKITDKWVGNQEWAGPRVRFGVAKALATQKSDQ